MRRHLLTALGRYWSATSDPVATLPVAAVPVTAVSGPLRLTSIALPDWGGACGVDGALLVPAEAAPPGADWRGVDWWLASFLLLEAWHERVWEQTHGPIHSYSFRLPGWDKRVWQRAWANRVALFLRALAGHKNAGADLDLLLGPLPPPDYLVTHDVDAIRKTLPIRLKQGAFNLFNAGRAIARGDLGKSAVKIRQTLRFLFGQEDWDTLAILLELERCHGIRARFHLYADPRPKSLRRWLFDPAYDVARPSPRAYLRALATAGAEIGLHPSFETWRETAPMAAQRAYLEQATGTPVTTCRQHWLRFSWRDTWSAQQAAGLTSDTTLMLNDRPGFRNAAALAWQPWDTSTARAHRLTALPTVLMDSHCYDYQPMTAAERHQSIRGWLDECRVVHGQIAVLWHPHTLTADYGWGDGFKEMIAMLQEQTPCPV